MSVSKRIGQILSVAMIAMFMLGMVETFSVVEASAASKIHVKKKTITIKVGKKYQQKLIDKKGKVIKATKVKWKSKKTSVAKINKKGKITAIKAGKAKMTAKFKGKTYKFTVKVKAVKKVTPQPVKVPEEPVVIEKKTIKTLVEYLSKNGPIDVQDSNSGGERFTNIKLTDDKQSVMFTNAIRNTSNGNIGLTMTAMAIDVDFDSKTDMPYMYFSFGIYPNGDTTNNTMRYVLTANVYSNFTPGDQIDWTVQQEYSGLTAKDLGLLEKDGAAQYYISATKYWNSALAGAVDMSLVDCGLINFK